MPGAGRRLAHGLNRSVTGNAQAFGFSITVTVTFGVVSTAQPHPSLPDLFAFALAAVSAFSLLNLVVAYLLSRQPEFQPTRVLLVATATDLLAVASAVFAAMVVRWLCHGITAWILAPFLAGLAYVLVQAVELAVGFARSREDD